MAHQSYSMQARATKQLMAERAKRLQDALELRQPDRIPLNMAGRLPAGRLWRHHPPGAAGQRGQGPGTPGEVRAASSSRIPSSACSTAPRPSLALGDRMTKWPGYGLPANGSFQFDEHEFMKAEDYDAFLRDPSDWAIRTYLPRAFKELEGLQYLPPLGMFAFGHYNLGNLPMLATPPVAAAVAGAEQGHPGRRSRTAPTWASRSGAWPRWASRPPPWPARSPRRRSISCPTRCAACAASCSTCSAAPTSCWPPSASVLDFQLEFAISFAKATGLKGAFIPLHRGSDGFMSLPQFEKFYWPQLKEHDGHPGGQRHHAHRLLRGRLGPAAQVPDRAAQGQDGRLVPGAATSSRSKRSSATPCASWAA